MEKTIWISSLSGPNRKSKIQNRKWAGCLAILVLLTGWVRMAEAQQPKKVPRLGYLTSLDAATESTRSEPFRLALRELGYIEGQNIAFEYLYADGKQDRLPEFALELVRLKVDLIVVPGVLPALAAKKATPTVPIVVANAPDPVGAGLVASLARPGGNITGLASLGTELNTKRLEILKDAILKLARVGLFCGADGSQHRIRPPAERAQGCGSGTEAKIGGDRDSTRR